MAIRSPYKIHRQMHIGDMLDELESKGALKWQWEYDIPKKSAFYWIELPGKAKRKLGTKDAEAAVQKVVNELEIVWMPVPYYGGLAQWMETTEKMDKMKSGELPKPWEAPAS